MIRTRFVTAHRTAMATTGSGNEASGPMSSFPPGRPPSAGFPYASRCSPNTTWSPETMTRSKPASSAARPCAITWPQRSGSSASRVITRNPNFGTRSLLVLPCPRLGAEYVLPG
jgi:hypothetical protein